MILPLIQNDDFTSWIPIGIAGISFQMRHFMELRLGFDSIGLYSGIHEYANSFKRSYFFFILLFFVDSNRWLRYPLIPSS